MHRITHTILAVVLAATPALAQIDVPGLDLNGQCVGDANNNQEVQINELVTAVNNALGSCPRLPITLNFRGVVGHDAFACGTSYTGIGTGASQFIPSDFRFYVSNIRLKPVGGDEVPLELDQDGIWQHENVALIDFETGPDDGCNEGNSATNTEIHGSVPAGVYTSVSFDLGLPFDLNHGNASTAPSPLNFSAMFWSWNAGYKFIRVDTADDKFRVHVGSIGCDGGSPSRPPTACSNPNLGRVTLSGFNPSHSIIEADLAALLSDNNIDVNEPGTPPGCMGESTDDDCGPIFSNLGINFADGTPSPGTQKFLRLADEHGGEDDHVEFVVGSSSDGGGALVAHPEFDVEEPVPLPFSECFGGTGDECDGGTRLFGAVNPGVEPLEESEPDESLFKLADDTEITLELTAIDAGLVMRLGDAMLDSVGDSVAVGTTPDFHADFETQLTQPGGGEPSGTFSASFKLTTSNDQYESSTIATVKFTPTDAGGGHD
jgi:uncharacterized repeat protein (TIGR04052 family)